MSAIISAAARVTEGEAPANGVADAISSKDARILSDDDHLAIRAALLALRDARWSERPRPNEDGCITLCSGKKTPERERTGPRVGFQTEAARFDGLRARAALDAGIYHWDPFELLHTLDNNVLWWLCKTHGLTDLNLHLTQTVGAGHLALCEAIALLEEDRCSRVLVVGWQTADQAEVQRSARALEQPAPGTPGAAVALVLESRASVRRRGVRSLAELELVGPTPRAAAADVGRGPLLALDALLRISAFLAPDGDLGPGATLALAELEAAPAIRCTRL